MIRKIPLHWQVVICMVVGALMGIALNPYSDYLKNPDLLKDKDPTEKFYLDEDMLEWKGLEADSFFVYNESTCQDEIDFDKFEKAGLNYLVQNRKIKDVNEIKIVRPVVCLELDQHLILSDYSDDYTIVYDDPTTPDINETIYLSNRDILLAYYANCYINEDKQGVYFNIENNSSEFFYYDENNDDIYQEKDGIYDEWDQFEDVNQNCEYNEPLGYFDANLNGIYDDDFDYKSWFNSLNYPDEPNEEWFLTRGVILDHVGPFKWHVTDSFEDYVEETIPKSDYRIISYTYNFMEFLGTVFVRLLKMIIVPLIFTSIILGVSSIGRGKKLGRLGLKTLAYYVSTSLIAIMIGLTLANLIRPGDNLEALSESPYDASQLKTDGGFSDIILRMIPENPIYSLANNEILSIIFFAIIFGIAMNFINNKYSDNLRITIEAIYKVILKLTQFIIKLIPIGVLGLMVTMVTDLGLESLQKLGWYALTLGFGLSIHFFIILPLILFFFVKRNPIIHYKAMSSAMLTAFSTSSSSATLPVTMKCVNENVKVSNKTSSFVLPMGATINMDGTALYECAGVLFIAQALGIPLDAGQQFIVVITALLASIGAAGIPSAGLVMLFTVTDAVGLQSDAVAIWVGSMLAIDRPLDMFRTMVNITSDSVGAAVIAKSEGEKLYD